MSGQLWDTDADTDTDVPWSVKTTGLPFELPIDGHPLRD
jgi:hypothetical protein